MIGELTRSVVWGVPGASPENHPILAGKWRETKLSIGSMDWSTRPRSFVIQLPGLTRPQAWGALGVRTYTWAPLGHGMAKNMRASPHTQVVAKHSACLVSSFAPFLPGSRTCAQVLGDQFHSPIFHSDGSDLT
eukprot:scaffold239193_cov11-Tisochrysis_lutea.AAC.1